MAPLQRKKHSQPVNSANHHMKTVAMCEPSQATPLSISTSRSHLGCNPAMIAAICVETLLRTETCWSLAGRLGDGIFAAASYVANYVAMRAQHRSLTPRRTAAILLHSRHRVCKRKASKSSPLSHLHADHQFIGGSTVLRQANERGI